MAAAVERTCMRRCRPMAVFATSAARIQIIKSTSVAVG
jgi:hypothetical protein